MIFVTGMFRSGTTFVARLLNQSDMISFASDPFFAVFKDFRNTLSDEKAHKVDHHAPLEDYYFDEKKYDFFQFIQGKKFSDVKIPDLKYLNQFTSESSLPYSDLLSKRIFEINASDYGSYLQRGEELLNATYGSKPLSGFKEVWANEFTPHIVNLFADRARVIQIVRDPRAILVSNFYSEGRYPILFLARQWRKLASLAHYYTTIFRNSTIVKYEDLIVSPEKTIRRICDFVGIPFEQKLLDTDEITDGGNQKWRQNSTFDEKSSSGFNINSVMRWKEKIEESDRLANENLCYPEMKLLGYTDFLDENFSKMSKECLIDKKEKLAKWILPYSNLDFEFEFEREKNRHSLLNRKASTREMQLNFLFPEIYEACRLAVQK